jgi:hypothetical protein
MSKATKPRLVAFQPVDCCVVNYDIATEPDGVALCPLHARAPALRDALRQLLDAACTLADRASAGNDDRGFVAAVGAANAALDGL